jgi:hypothetical protein
MSTSEVVTLGEGGEDEDDGVSVTGGVALTVNALFAGDSSMLPARSMARTSNLWDPLLRGWETQGDEQGRNFSASTLHWNVALGSSDEKVNVVVGSSVGLLGPVPIVVSGGVRSTVHA